MLEAGFGGAERDGIRHGTIDFSRDITGADLVGSEVNSVPARGRIETDDLGDIDRNRSSSRVSSIR